MATTKIPRASDWKTLVQKYSLKDNGLLKALAQCEKLSDDPDEATKVLDLVLKLAATLAKDKQVVAQKDVVEFLDNPTACGQGLTVKMLPGNGMDTGVLAATSTSGDD